MFVIKPRNNKELFTGLKKKLNYDELVSYIATDKPRKLPNRAASFVANSYEFSKLNGIDGFDALQDSGIQHQEQQRLEKNIKDASLTMGTAAARASMPSSSSKIKYFDISGGDAPTQADEESLDDKLEESAKARGIKKDLLNKKARKMLNKIKQREHTLMKPQSESDNEMDQAMPERDEEEGEHPKPKARGRPKAEPKPKAEPIIPILLKVVFEILSMHFVSPHPPYS